MLSTFKPTKRLIWFVSFMARHKSGVKKTEIDVAWSYSGLNDGYKEMPRETFNRLKSAALDVFNIDIVYDKSSRRWKIDYEGDLEDNKYIRWLVDSFYIMGIAHKNPLLQKHILFETPSEGTENLEIFTTAIKDGKAIRFRYNTQTEDRCQMYELEPYILRQYDGRWYVSGKLTDESYDELKTLGVELAEKYKRLSLVRMFGDRNSLLTFSLDMLSDIALTEKNYKIPKGFNPQDYAGNIIGPLLSHNDMDNNGMPMSCLGDRFIVGIVDIIIKTNGSVGNEILRRPLHGSQELIKEYTGDKIKDSYKIFKYRLQPTAELYQMLLGYGSDVEILAPDYIREKMRKKVEKIIENYKK